MVIFNDGFHSGFLLPGCDRVAALDPQTAGPPAAMPWLEVGFGADAWIAARDPGACAAVGLALSHSDAVLLCGHLADTARPPRDEVTPIRFWRLRLSAASFARLIEEIHAWVAADVVRQRSPEQPSFVRFSTRKWSSFRNCNDFVVEALVPAGLDLAWRPAYTSAVFTGVMDRTERELADAGVLTIGIPP